MYRRILAAVDGSPTSTRGLNEAIALAADQGARLYVLNVVDELVALPTAGGEPIVDAADLLAALERDGRKALEEARVLAAARKVDAACTQWLSGGVTVSDGILRYARKCRADLIVLGTHGRRGMNRLLMGSDAERVLREAPVPVLLVRGEKPARVPRGAARAAPVRRRTASLAKRRRVEAGASSRGCVA